MGKRQKSLFRHTQIEQKAKNIKLYKQQLDAVRWWAERMESGSLHNEKENYGHFQRHIIEDLLGFKGVKHESENIDFVVDNNSLVIECKGMRTDLDEKQYRKNELHDTPMKQLWDYMGHGEWGITRRVVTK